VLCWFAYAQPWTGTDLTLGLFLIQAWVPGHPLSITCQVALSIEIAFYLVFPWVMIFARRIGVVRFAWLSILFWLVSQVSVTLLNFILQRHVSQWLIDHTFYFPASHLNSFLIGMTAALLTPKWTPPMWLAALVAGASLTTSRFLILHSPKLTHLHIVVEDGLHAPFFAASVASIVRINSRFLFEWPARAAIRRMFSPLVSSATATSPPQTRGISVPSRKSPHATQSKGL